MPRMVGRLHQWYAFLVAVGLVGASPLLWDFRDYLFPPSPSYAIAVLGTLAVVMTLVLPKEPSKGEKTLWMMAAFSLMFLEIWAVSHDRAKQQKQFNDTRIQLFEIANGVQTTDFDIIRVGVQAHFDSQTGSGYLQAVRKLAAQVSVNTPAKLSTTPATSVTPAPANSANQVTTIFPASSIASPPNSPATLNSEGLKEQGLQLAIEINDWIASVSKDAPNVSPNTMLWLTPPPDEVEKAKKYVERLDSEWRSKFETPAISMISKLHVFGVLIGCRAGFASDTDFSTRLNRNKRCADDIEKAAIDLKE